MKSSVAIITRTVNRPMLLKRAIESVLAQDYSNWVHVIVNDGGDPKQVEATIKPYIDSYAGRFLLISHDNPKGMEAASNAGIQESQSDYVLIHDDDDSLLPTFLSESVAYLDKVPWPKIYGVATLVNIIEEQITDGKVHQTNCSLFRNLDYFIEIKELAKVNHIPNISFLYKRSVLNEIGYYDEDLPVLGDWDFNLRFIANYDIGVIKKPLANYHQRPLIKQGELSNTLHSQLDKHKFYSTLVRNRFVRQPLTQSIGLLMAQQSNMDRSENTLRRLYKHPVLGRCIKFWARWVNPNIPSDIE